MDGTGRSARDALIVSMARRGVGRNEIGRAVGLTPGRVRAIVLREGAAEKQAPPERSVDGIWGLPPDELRRAIIERQRRGARRALQNMEGRSNGHE